MKNQYPLSQIESNCKNIYNKGRFMLVSSGWMKLAVDNFKPKDFFLFVKRHNEEVSERCLIYTGTELGLSLWCHQDWKRVGVTFLL